MSIDMPMIQRIAAELREHMGDDFDEDAFFDTLDGETDVLDIADWMLGRLLEDQALSDAIDQQHKQLALRRARVDARINAMRGRIFTLLDATGAKKMERPRGTISRRPGSVYVNITDDAAIPSQLRTVKTTTTPDKTAIKAQIEAGVTVPGAELVRGPDSVAVRVS